MYLPQKQRKETDEVLAKLGLNAKDREVYLTMLTLGRTTLSPIAKATGLPLTTVQAVVGRLAEDGLIEVTKRKSRHLYEAAEPTALRRRLERQLEEVAGIIPFLKVLRSQKTAAAKIRVYYRERMADIFHEALKAGNKTIHEIVAARDFQQILGEKFHFSRRRVAAGVHLKSLRVESREIKKYSRATHVRELREAKFLPRELTFRASVMFWDDTVAFFTTKDEGLAWVVESAAFRDMLAQLFELLWSVSRKMETV